MTIESSRNLLTKLFKDFKIYNYNFLSEKNKKRDIRDWYSPAGHSSDRYREPQQQNEVQRGDIPILHGDCDGKCFHL